MPPSVLSMSGQFRVGIEAIKMGDIDLLSKVLTDPDTITTAEQRTAAEQMGLPRGLTNAFVDIITDPTVWIAMLMSRAFPTGAWLRGTIPKRYVGEYNQFTGLSSFARPVEEFFRGTPIPRLIALKQRREAEALKAGERIFEHFRRPNWQTEMPIVSMLLEGVNVSGATPELQRVALDVRNHMDELWGFLRQTQKIEGGLGSAELTYARGVDFLPKQAPKYLRNYLPHIPITGDETVIQVSGAEALRRLGRRGIRQAMRLKGVEMPWTINAADELASDFVRWQAFQGQVGHRINPRLFRRMRHDIPLASELGQDLFVTDLNVLLPRYVHSVARTYALNAPISAWERQLATSYTQNELTGKLEGMTPSSEPVIVQIINQGLGATGAKKLRRQIAGTNHFEEVMVPGSVNMPTLSALNRLVRATQGVAGDDEILFGNLFSNIGARLNRLQTSLGAKGVTEAEAAIRALERHGSYRRISNGLASYFYTTTLGLNPWSALQNLLQPVLTTSPAIGIGPTLKGMKVLAERLPAYARNFAQEHGRLTGGRAIGVTERVNVALENSFRQTFPEFAGQGIKIDPRLFDIDEGLLTGPRGILGQRRLIHMDAFNKLLLQPFTHSEMSNQIISFYGGKEALRSAIRSGEYHLGIEEFGAMTKGKLDDLLNFEAGMIVNSTQFRPGPGSRTQFQGVLPAPFRMFTSFPVRLANFFAQSTVRGAMTQKQLESVSMMSVLSGGETGRLARQKLASLGTGRNVGTLARSYLFGRIATEGARETLDVDLEGSLGMTDVYNVAPRGQPFAPLPMPPLPGTIWGLISAASTRDIDKMQPMYLPGMERPIPVPRSLFPGGVAISRAVRAVQQWRPDLGGFADDDERLMYRGDTPDLILAMLGVPLDKNRRSREAIARTHAIRMRVRDLRRKYAVATINGDVEGLSNLQTQWGKFFPDLPPLQVEQTDILRYRQMQRIPSVQRMLRTLGNAGRYLEWDMYEHDPDLLAGGV